MYSFFFKFVSPF